MSSHDDSFVASGSSPTKSCHSASKSFENLKQEVKFLAAALWLLAARKKKNGVGY
jgi:hypothetical protein